MKTRRNQSGLTLIEILASLAILSAVTAGVARLIDQYTEDVKTTVVSQHMESVGKAARQYIKDNYSTVQSFATPTTPALVTVPMLIASGYLDTGFSIKNNYGHSVCVLVLEPTANTLEGLVVAEGGQTVDDLTLGGIASSLGASGGGVYSSAPTTLRGAMGGWSVAIGNYANANAQGFKCDGTTAGAPTIAAGRPVMAVWFENSDTSANFINRNSVPGRTDLNTMNTSLIMNSPIIMSSVQTIGAACTTTGAIARDAAGAIVVCQAGTWKASGGAIYWKDPVATFAALPITDPVGAVRMTLDTGRAFMWTGGGWNALAVDQSGNLTVPGQLTAANGRIVARDAIGEGGVLQMQGANGTNIYLENLNGVFRLINHPWTAQIFSIDQAGNVNTIGSVWAGNWIYSNSMITANGRLTTNEFVQINGGASEGTGCAPNGLIGRDGNGMVLFCQSGIWTRAGSDAGTLCGGATYLNGIGWYAWATCKGVTLPSCPAGYFLSQVHGNLIGSNGGPGVTGAFAASCVKS